MLESPKNIDVSIHEDNPVLIRTIERITEQLLRDYLPDTEESHKEVLRFLSNIKSLFRDRSYPGTYFEAMAHGAFKECYESGIPGWIIKFTSKSNDTTSEQQILECAKEAGLSQVFVPTFFVRLPFDIICSFMDDDNEDLEIYDSELETYVMNPDFKATLLDGFQLQPMIEVQEDRDYCQCTRESTYNEDPLYSPKDGTMIPFKVVNDMNIFILDWLDAVLQIHGYDYFMRLHDFIKKYGISDLHTRNIGYLHSDGVEYPIILDWLSRS